MRTLLRKYWKILLVVLGAALVIALILGMRRAPKLTIVSSIPPGGAGNVDLFAPVTITFSAPIDPNLLSLTTTPDEVFVVVPRNSTTVELSHKLAFSPATNYTLTLTYQGSVSTLAFTTQKAQGDPRLLQTIRNQMLIDYPLAEKTPYETSLYRVVYRAPLTLEITLKNKNVSEDQAISQIKTWVTSHGGDAAAHKYTVVSPKN